MRRETSGQNLHEQRAAYTLRNARRMHISYHNTSRKISRYLYFMSLSLEEIFNLCSSSFSYLHRYSDQRSFEILLCIHTCNFRLCLHRPSFRWLNKHPDCIHLYLQVLLREIMNFSLAWLSLFVKMKSMSIVMISLQNCPQTNHFFLALSLQLHLQGR